MFLRFFDALTLTLSGGNWNTFSDAHLFDTDTMIEYSYTKRWSKVGEFSLSLPFRNETLSSIRVNGFIQAKDDMTNETDWLWIQNVTYDGKKITVSGKDAKGLLDTRIAVYGDTQHKGTEGYDVASGNTKVCIRHYLNSHAISPSDAARKLPIRHIVGTVGLSEDSYMARFEYLSDIVSELCDGAEIGYDLQVQNLYTQGFVVVLSEGDRRDFGQSDNPRVIFSLRHRNITSQNFSHGVSDLFNAIYATDSEGYTGEVSRGSTPSSGLSRRECNITVSSVGFADDWFDKYALEQVKDNVETHHYTIDVGVSSGYGTDYSLGDTVTILDDYTDNRFNARITEVTKTYSTGSRKITLVLGQQKQKPLEKIVNDFMSGTARHR